MNLDLIPNADIHREVDLGALGKSVDFIVIFPHLILLVEVKATRLTELARTGLSRLSEDRERTIAKAWSQIERTHQVALDGHPALAFIPGGRPFRGLVVTLEPYWLATSEFWKKPPSAVPTALASMREMEHFCTAAQTLDVANILLNLPTEHFNHVLDKAIAEDKTKNPILQRNWEATLKDEQ